MGIRALRIELNGGNTGKVAEGRPIAIPSSAWTHDEPRVFRSVAWCLPFGIHIQSTRETHSFCPYHLPPSSALALHTVNSHLLLRPRPPATLDWNPLTFVIPYLPSNASIVKDYCTFHSCVVSPLSSSSWRRRLLSPAWSEHHRSIMPHDHPGAMVTPAARSSPARAAGAVPTVTGTATV